MITVNGRRYALAHQPTVLQTAAGEAKALGVGYRRTEALERDARGQVRGGGREDVAAVEGPADLGQPVLRSGE